jgi:3-oxoacyl-[acyl-carrier protein] reductase
MDALHMNTQKIAIVTGGSRGIGAAITAELAALGFLVVVVASKDSAGAETVVATVAAQGGKAVFLQADISKPDQIEQLFGKIGNTYGRIDVLVNNAGISGPGKLSDIDWDAATRVLDVNFKSVLFCSAQALPHFPESGGAIINISSVLASQPSAGQGLYAASKAAVEALTRVMAQELGAKNIRVNAVAPGPTETDLLPNDIYLRDYIKSRTPLGRAGLPADIAKVVAFLASGTAAWMTGQIINADGGIRV